MKETDFALLVDEMEAFLRVPKVPYEIWSSLDIDTKAALLIATKRIEVERIVTSARAVQSQDATLRISAEIDGGTAWVRRCLVESVDRYLAVRRTI